MKWNPLNVRYIALMVSIGLLIFSSSYASLPQNIQGQPLPSLAPMLKNVLPGVVNIAVRGDMTKEAQAENTPSSQKQPHKRSMPSNPDERGKKPHKFMAVGSGVIINAQKGYIVTNAHVVKDGKVITVTLKDGRQYTAELVGADPASDIAVIKIQANHLLALTFANSSKVQVGDFVVAIGSPFGLSQSVTSGIVSALQRTGLGIDHFEDFIQTDAPINPGNSGGALINLSGQMIGMSTAIISADGGSLGIGFAIPANMVSDITKQLIKYGSVQRGMMGIMVETITPNLAKAFSLPKVEGAVVTKVTPFSPAAKAGLKVGDVVLAINNIAIHSAAHLTNTVGLVRVGTKLHMQINRRGNLQEINLITTSAKDFAQLAKSHDPFLYGLNLRNFSQLNTIHGVVEGVQVVAVSQDSAAFGAMPTGLRAGDVIISANDIPVKTISGLKKIVDEAAKKSQNLLLNILRGSSALFVVMK